MIIAIGSIVLGLLLLVWSANRFVDSAASIADYWGMSPLLIGMVIVGFGTSAPELAVSTLAALQKNPGIALGNAYGSNITNIALILGLSAIINPIKVNSLILRKELPILTGVTIITIFLIYDKELGQIDALILLLIFSILLAWAIYQGIREKTDSLGDEITHELVERKMSIKQAFLGLAIGLILLIISSRILVWGSTEIARTLGISDLVIGLTVVAVGTSLPELASSVIAARKGEHDIALGNILGSNLFNTLAVVGIAGIINPMNVGQEVLSRDIAMMTALTVSLFIIGYRFRGIAVINRYEGAALFAAYIGYTVFLGLTAFKH